MPAAEASYSRRWLSLAVVGVAQVIVLLDATTVNLARGQPSGRCILRTATANGSSLPTCLRSAACSRWAGGSAICSAVSRRA